MSMRQKKLPIAALERIDDLCADFERRWRSKVPPRIDSVIRGVSSSVERDALLAELVVLDIDYRRRRGEMPSKENYLAQFPNDANVINDAFSETQTNRERVRAASFEPPTIAWLSDRFPNLEILELIGAGGMGAVYKARQKGLDRIVAIKILPDEFGHDLKFAVRFAREARTLARLNHPNIVSVYEFGNVEDTYYFLMEYVAGSTLRDAVRSQQLDPPHALGIVPHLCDALQYAHDQGVIHRDIKPENILLSNGGAVKIADFGLSRILDDDNQQDQLTGTHQIMGTLRYMAPEQLESSHNVDHRADIYSLGVVIYEMLTGELPIGRFASPSSKVEVDIRLDEVVLRTLEKEPNRRYQQASQIKSDVESIVSNDSMELAPTLTIESARALGSQSRDEQHSNAELLQQEVAGRLLLTRRQLLSRVESSLRPLFRWQILQILFGVLLIAVGAHCWAQNTHIPHRLFSGLAIHLYGLFLIGCAATVTTRIRRLDYSESVQKIRNKLNELQSVYLRLSPVMGFPWWLMWIPTSVAIGFDEVVLYKESLYPSLIVGVIGLILSLGLYLRLMNASETWKSKFSASSITNASRLLDEIETAQIH